MGRILLVDDDVVVRQVVRALLERSHHEVIEAGSGVEALELFDAARPDLVITDLLMPRMNGLELIVELQRRWPGVKTIAISGGGGGHDDPMLLLARDLGAVRAFAKPLDIPALLSAVSSLT